MQILKAFGIDPQKESQFSVPFIPVKTAESASAFWSDAFGVKGGSLEVIGLNLSAGASIRLWPTASYLKLIDMLKSHGRDKFLLFAVGADRNRAEEICAMHPGEVQVIPDGESIIYATALLQQLTILVSPDTSMIHIARAAQIPVVGLYNDSPKNVAMWHPYLQRENALISNSPSSIDSISPEEVCRAVVRVFSGVSERVT
jgi:ADP-heptose:LPS heptosyltransferase